MEKLKDNLKRAAHDFNSWPSWKQNVKITQDSVSYNPIEEKEKQTNPEVHGGTEVWSI